MQHITAAGCAMHTCKMHASHAGGWLALEHAPPLSWGADLCCFPPLDGCLQPQQWHASSHNRLPDSPEAVPAQWPGNNVPPSPTSTRVPYAATTSPSALTGRRI